MGGLTVQCCPKPVEIRRREIVASIIGEDLAPMPVSGKFDVDAMIRYWLQAMDVEAASKPDLMVLPEICDYWRGIPEGREQEWLDLRGNRILHAFQEYARKHRMYIVYPTNRMISDGHNANSSILIDRDGDVSAVYDKVYPTVCELEQGVIPGTGPVVADTDFGRLGLLICFDLNFWDLQEKMAAVAPDVLAFSSYYHGDFMQQAWAHRCQAYFLGSTVGSLGKDILGPAGEVLYQERSNCRRSITRPINTNCAVIHWGFNVQKVAEARLKYGRKLDLRNSGTCGCATLLSNDPDLPVRDVLKEFEIETWREYYARSAFECHKKLDSNKINKE